LGLINCLQRTGVCRSLGGIARQAGNVSLIELQKLKIKKCSIVFRQIVPKLIAPQMLMLNTSAQIDGNTYVGRS